MGGADVDVDLVSVAGGVAHQVKHLAGAAAGQAGLARRRRRGARGEEASTQSPTPRPCCTTPAHQPTPPTLPHPRIQLQVPEAARQQRLVGGCQLYKVGGVGGEALVVRARRRPHRRQRGRNLFIVCTPGTPAKNL